MTWFLGDRRGSKSGNIILSEPFSSRNKHLSSNITVSKIRMSFRYELKTLV